MKAWKKDTARGVHGKLHPTWYFWREARQGKVVNVWLLLIGGSFLPFLEIEHTSHLCSLSGQA